MIYAPKPRAEQARENADTLRYMASEGNAGLEAANEEGEEPRPLYMQTVLVDALLAIEARLDEIAALMRDR